MASQVDIVNGALTILGSDRITSIDDDVKAAREAKAIWELRRDALLGAHNWNFAKARLKMSADADAPSFQYSLQYTLPVDCLRVIMLNEFYVGADLTNYRGSPTEEYTIEGRKVLTSWGAPLPLVYVKRVTDTPLFDPCFAWALSTDLAMWLAEPLTQSDTKRARAEAAYRRALSEAIRVNAIQLPPQKLADDEWILARL